MVNHPAITRRGTIHPRPAERPMAILRSLNRMPRKTAATKDTTTPAPRIKMATSDSFWSIGNSMRSGVSTTERM